MADRVFAYCPLCRKAGSPGIEATREAHIISCPMGHSMQQEAFWAMDPDKIKTQIVWKPGVGDVKVEVWVNQEIWQKAREAMGDRIHKTVESILRSAMSGPYVLVDGQQAAKLHKLGIRTGAEMLAAAEQNQTLAVANEDLTQQVNKWERRIAEAMGAVN